ncbi:MAG: hypothetical protein OXI54_03845 [Chloroflexota bacterium]|nr:hypothetical protein [Chloroflexota bacterium]MDE2683264.1 hypothetical protein [Chloroflexota bacterium]
MRDQFVADVGDFGKYGLLRRLCGITDPETLEADLRLGVVWYMTPDDPDDTAGRFTGYLAHTKQKYLEYHDCDPGLWHDLQTLVPHRRCVGCIEKSAILPADTIYFGLSLHNAGWNNNAVNNREVRARWWRSALDGMADADVVFLDPDNTTSGRPRTF